MTAAPLTPPTERPLARQSRLFYSADDARDPADLIVPESHAALLATLTQTQTRWPRGGLVLVGEAGAGKSHWARACVNAHQGVRVSALAPMPAPDTAFARGVGLVAIDNADGVADEAGLFRLLEGAATGAGQVLLTSATSPTQWPLHMRDLKSRIVALPQAVIPAPDEVFFAALLTRLCRLRYMKLDDTVARALARSVERSYLEAARVVEALDALVSKGARPVSAQIATRVVRLLASYPKAGPPDEL